MDLRRINFGIEIETVKRTRERVAQAIQSVVGGQVRHRLDRLGHPLARPFDRLDLDSEVDPA